MTYLHNILAKNILNFYSSFDHPCHYVYKILYDLEMGGARNGGVSEGTGVSEGPVVHCNHNRVKRFLHLLFSINF